ncbi:MULTISPECIES: DUF2946 family protein [unclassified Sphingomonas]|uniref:DUF2946 family protein n=1 Tax=unclassified Sphingomonas TaxID=196159 RepID=UPI0010F7A05B|nr:MULTISPECIES: DUF2946 family protein [unclassified Sphingomonas]
MLTAILAFLCQSLVIQGHLHANPVTHAAGASPVEASSISTAALSGEDQSPCPICQEIAQAGTYLPVASATFVPPTPIALWRAVTSSLELALRQRSHAWQSRAPPLLQA